MKSRLPRFIVWLPILWFGLPFLCFPIRGGEAHIYREDLHGQPLANGEIFLHDRLTAGHPSIALGTVVRVTNLANQQSIDVLINDRWPGNFSDIILSRTAANLIGVISGAENQVRIQPLLQPENHGEALRSVRVQNETSSVPLPMEEPGAAQSAAPATAESLQGLFFLEFASYKNMVQAKMLALKLTRKGAPSKVVQDDRAMFHVISDGYFATLEEATAAYYLVNDNVGYTPLIKKM